MLLLSFEIMNLSDGENEVMLFCALAIGIVIANKIDRPHKRMVNSRFFMSVPLDDTCFARLKLSLISIFLLCFKKRKNGVVFHILKRYP